MQNILIVEEDPIVRLDLQDILRSRFPDCRLLDLSMEEAISLVSNSDSEPVALVAEHLTDDLRLALQRSRARVALVLTNSLPPDAIPDDLPHLSVVERPFDTADVVSALLQLRGRLNA